MALIQSTAIPSGATDFEIDQSLRFDSDSSAYLSKTMASDGSSRTTWTMSFWLKRGKLATTQEVFRMHDDGNNHDPMWFEAADDTFHWEMFKGGGWFAGLVTNRVFRDTNAWYHIVLTFDTTQGTSTDRLKMYINGVQETSFGTTYYPAQNSESLTNKAGPHYWGANNLGANEFDGYLAELHFIDGTALTPSSFGETGDYGEWKPIQVSGLTYGTNGYYLDFANSSALGDDAAGSNDWTVNNLTASDQMVDSPTNNFATLNPLQRFVTNTQAPTEGNLKTICGSTNTAYTHCIGSTIEVTSGKWYFEAMIGTTTNSHFSQVGVGNSNNIAFTELMNTTANSANVPWDGSYGWGYNGYNGNKEHSNTQTSYGSQASLGDIIGVAIDMDNSKIWFSDNGTWIASGNPATGANAAYTNVTGSIVPVVSTQDGSTAFVTANFGQDSSFAGEKTAQGNQDGNSIGDFYYEPPTGFLALCTSNLPDVAVVPSEHFNTVLYSGTGSNQDITGVGFVPDFVWAKDRTSAHSHMLTDKVRGIYKTLNSDNTYSESSLVTALRSFNSDGFSVGSNANINNNGSSFVAWNWKANGSGSSNSNGSITSTVSANTDAGFSIVSYTSNGTTGATVGHGLSSAPEMIILKNRDDSSGNVGTWGVFNTTIGNDRKLRLDSTIAHEGSSWWNSTTPTSSVFTIGSSATGANYTGNNKIIAYCFHSVDGYSKCGSYTGNGNADGTFVYTGFRPAYVMVKRTDNAENWVLYDNKRAGYNADNDYVLPNSSVAEYTGYKTIDLTSNGFKLRTTHSDKNASGTYIYLCFAETPFKYSNAR